MSDLGLSLLFGKNYFPGIESHILVKLGPSLFYNSDRNYEMDVHIGPGILQ